ERVESRDQRGEIVFDRRGDAQRRLHARHDQRRADAFAGDVADGESEVAVGKLEEVVVVAADFVAGNALRRELDTGNVARRQRQETTLNLAAELQLALHPLLLDDLEVHRRVLHGDGHV